jgi:hypothetical protein
MAKFVTYLPGQVSLSQWNTNLRQYVLDDQSFDSMQQSNSCYAVVDLHDSWLARPSEYLVNLGIFLRCVCISHSNKLSRHRSGVYYSKRQQSVAPLFHKLFQGSSVIAADVATLKAGRIQGVNNVIKHCNTKALRSLEPSAAHKCKQFAIGHQILMSQ